MNEAYYTAALYNKRIRTVAIGLVVVANTVVQIANYKEVGHKEVNHKKTHPVLDAFFYCFLLKYFKS